MKTPGEYEEEARNNFLNGYNCTQSVVAAFSDIMDVEPKVAIRIASPFGGGMGRLREVCGCVSGMYIVLGYLYGYDDPKVYDAKKELYERVQFLAKKYSEANGSIVCREILGLSDIKEDQITHIPERRTEEYYKKRPCPQLAGYAAKLLAEYISEHPY